MLLELELLRYSSKEDDTLGLMFTVNPYSQREFACHTLEDESREVKLYGETRIPAGRYEIKLRNVGGMTARYQQRFPGMHEGMLWLQDVPGFEWIYIHPGNTDDHTNGCILVGDNVKSNHLSGNGRLISSTEAYVRLYKQIAAALEEGEVWITIEDYDGV